MSEQKPSTADILAKIRSGKQGPSVPAAKPASEDTPVAAAPASEPVSAPVTDTAPKKPAAKPGSTADILAAIRSQASTASSAPAAPPSPAVAKPAAVAASGGAPSSTNDILAKIRAGKASTAAPADATPVKTAVTTKPVAVATSGEPKPSIEEMLKAVRGEAAPATATALTVAAKPVLVIPQKPVVSTPKKGTVERRSFLVMCLSPLAIAWASMSATAGIWLLDLARFMFPNVLVEPPTKFKIGPSSDYPIGSVSTKWLAARGVWIVHTDQYKGKNLIYALASVCTHLGCTPNWLEGEQKYKCPCHGSGFYVTGINFEGPAPRPLERVGIRVAADGMLEVDKSVKFQEEMGQWDDGASYVDASLA